MARMPAQEEHSWECVACGETGTVTSKTALKKAVIEHRSKCPARKKEDDEE